MSDKLVIQIRALSMDEGFELVSEAMLRDPLRRDRLYEAVVAAVELGLGHETEIQIFDSEGSVAEVLELPTLGATHFHKILV
ncbi:MAG: hypothetical protein QOE70_1124 [Chthoniobacter sp.]|jgi:hypothetical protein|nr:hypothetical protein [Chthoniobacter sp.]